MTRSNTQSFQPSKDALLSRSYLFAPGNNEVVIEKALRAGADAIVLDLEDAVPDGEKTKARSVVGAALRKHREEFLRLYVRVNAISTELWEEDVPTIVEPSLRGVRLAKAESAAQIEILHEAILKAEQSRGITLGSIRIVPTIESASGLLAAFDIARAPRVECLSFGEADFLRDIGGSSEASAASTLYAKSHLVVVSRAARIAPPIAPAFIHLDDEPALRASSEFVRRLGFFGRSCIHPKQIPIIHAAFAPTEAELSEARSVIESFNRASIAGSGVSLAPGGLFVDKAVVESARALLNLAECYNSTPKREADASMGAKR